MKVVGLDLVNIQPEKCVTRPFSASVPADLITSRIPPNLRFRVPRDYESPWSLGEDSWDLIHCRMACGSVSSWPELYQKIYTCVL